MSSSSVDFKEARKVGPVVEPGSLQHYNLLFSATRLIQSDFGLPGFGPILGRLVRIGAWQPKRVQLQHGVTGIMLSKVHYEDVDYCLYFSSSEKEKNLIVKELGIPEAQVKVLGLPRFDELSNNASYTARSILFMPTWRRWLSLNAGEQATPESTSAFINSTYYRVFKDFLSSSALNRLLENHDMRIKIYLHHRFQRFNESFKCFESDRITLLSQDETDPKELILKSAALITDFSSVLFDFAYMGKPIIHFAPDEEEYYSKHVSIEGYYSLEGETFGAVARTTKEALYLIEELGENNFMRPELYSTRVRDFFKFLDSNNRKRAVEAIKQLKL